jgi:hypothetical protein
MLPRANQTPWRLPPSIMSPPAKTKHRNWIHATARIKGRRRRRINPKVYRIPAHSKPSKMRHGTYSLTQNASIAPSWNITPPTNVKIATNSSTRQISRRTMRYRRTHAMKHHGHKSKSHALRFLLILSFQRIASNSPPPCTLNSATEMHQMRPSLGYRKSIGKC